MWAQPQMENVPGSRAAHSCDIIRNILYLFGGWNGKKALNDVWTLSFDTLTWNNIATDGCIPRPRNNHASIVVGNKLYVHGGHDGAQWLNDFYVLNIDTRTWSIVETSGNRPLARACHTMSRIGRKIYMFGGYDGVRCFNTVDILDLDTFTWMQPTIHGPNPPGPRNAHTMTVLGNRLIMFGGHSGTKHLRDLYTLDIETMTWTEIHRENKALFPPGLRGHSANLVGNKIFLFGGYDGRGRSSELFVLNVETMQWETPLMRGQGHGPCGRQRHTACVLGTKLIVIGGFDGFKWLQDMHVLDIGKLEQHTLSRVAKDGLIMNLRSLVNNPDMYYDITFIVEDRPIYAHKAIIAVQCAHFQAMFSSGMKESRSSEILVPDWSYSTFLQLLEFLYAGCIETLGFDDALELIGLADHYNLDGLLRLCENTLMNSVNDENICTILRAAQHYQVISLKQKCMNYILTNFETVVETKGFDSLSADPHLLLEVTRSSMNRFLISKSA